MYLIIELEEHKTNKFISSHRTMVVNKKDGNLQVYIKQNYVIIIKMVSGKTSFLKQLGIY